MAYLKPPWFTREKAGRAVEGYFRRLPREADHPVFVVTPKTT
jgi:hypothetical protein